MRRTIVATLLATLATLSLAQSARAGAMTYLSIGDSVAFGETTFTQNPSNGDRGFVGPYANYIASQNGGVRPSVVNLAIDGETSTSFLTGSGRVHSIPGSTDQTVASWNTNYSADPTVSQNVKFQQAIAAANASGSPVGVVTVSLGANDLFMMAASSAFQSATPSQQQAMLTSTLGKIASNDAIILAEVHTLLPNAKVMALGEYNPFPANPSNPLNAIAGPAIQGLNATIQSVAAAWGAHYVDIYTPFVGHEANYTYLSATSDNVHPNALGYSVIASQVAGTPVPEPSTLAVMGLGFAAIVTAGRRRLRRNRAA